MGLSSGNRFGFSHTFRLRACLWKALRTQECAIVLGWRSFRESREESGSTVRLAGKNWKPGGEGFVSFVSPFVSPGVMIKEGEPRLAQ